MNQSDFIEAIYQALCDQNFTPMSKKQVERGVKAGLDLIRQKLSEGESVSFQGFGTFVIRTNAKRQGRNPKTGALIEIPETKVVKFKTSAALKELVAK